MNIIFKKIGHLILYDGKMVNYKSLLGSWLGKPYVLENAQIIDDDVKQRLRIYIVLCTLYQLVLISFIKN